MPYSLVVLVHTVKVLFALIYKVFAPHFMYDICTVHKNALALMQDAMAHLIRMFPSTGKKTSFPRKISSQ